MIVSMDETTAQTIVASITVGGSFAVIITAQVTGNQPGEGILTLITAVLTGVIGFYFGSRGTVGTANAVSNAAARTAAAVTTAHANSANDTPQVVVNNGSAATP